MYLDVFYKTNLSEQAFLAIDEVAQRMHIRIAGSRRNDAYMCYGNFGGIKKYLRHQGVWKEYSVEDGDIVTGENAGNVWDAYYPHSRAAFSAFLTWCMNNKQIPSL